MKDTDLQSALQRAHDEIAFDAATASRREAVAEGARRRAAMDVEREAGDGSPDAAA